MPLIEIDDLSHTYAGGVQALRSVSIAVEPGEYLALTGANGSGKTTLGLHLNGLLAPTTGRVTVAGRDTRAKEHLAEIRRTVGMVFQSPVDQIVASVVEEDVAFGPENLGVPAPELRRRVREALETVGMWEHRHRSPHQLSAGQQQRVAIAGALAMESRVLVLDEAAAMLDPRARADLLTLLDRLNGQGMALVVITHDMTHAVRARRVVVLAGGKVVADGPPRDVLTRTDLAEWGLRPPFAASLAGRLRAAAPWLRSDVLTVDELADALAAAR